MRTCFDSCHLQSLGNGDQPMHVPYWNKKARNGIFVVPHHDYALMVQADLQFKFEESQRQLEEATSANSQLWEALSLAGQEEAASTGDAAGSTDGAGQKESDKAKSCNQGSGSGWGNKCVRLVKAVLDEHWGFATKLANEYAEVPWVKRALEAKKWKDNKADVGDGPKSSSPWASGV